MPNGKSATSKNLTYSLLYKMLLTTMLPNASKFKQKFAFEDDADFTIKSTPIYHNFPIKLVVSNFNVMKMSSNDITLN